MRRKISRFFAGILAAALVISSGSGAVSARGTDRAVMWSAREAEDPEKDILEDNGDAGSSGPESNAPAGSRTGDDVQGSAGAGNDASAGSGSAWVSDSSWDGFWCLPAWAGICGDRESSAMRPWGDDGKPAAACAF